MKIAEIAKLLDAQVHCGSEYLDTDIDTAFGCDMMSDVLAYGQNQAVLLTGLVNPQVIRTAEMMDISCVVFVMGKSPTEVMIDLALDRSLILLSTEYKMFSACGILHAAGLEDGGKVADEEAI